MCVMCAKGVQQAVQRVSYAAAKVGAVCVWGCGCSVGGQVCAVQAPPPAHHPTGTGVQNVGRGGGGNVGVMGPGPQKV